jgi:hypothetical protein
MKIFQAMPEVFYSLSENVNLPCLLSAIVSQRSGFFLVCRFFPPFFLTPSNRLGVTMKK